MCTQLDKNTTKTTDRYIGTIMGKKIVQKIENRLAQYEIMCGIKAMYELKLTTD